VGRYCPAFVRDAMRSDDYLISDRQTIGTNSSPLCILLSFSEIDRLGGSAGAMSGGAEGTQAGVIPRAIAGIFELSSSMEVLSLSVHCSFLQIYNEQLFDMLRYLPYLLLPLQKN
jgi:hypothetical protein